MKKPFRSHFLSPAPTSVGHSVGVRAPATVPPPCCLHVDWLLRARAHVIGGGGCTVSIYASRSCARPSRRRRVLQWVCRLPRAHRPPTGCVVTRTRLETETLGISPISWPLGARGAASG